MKASKLTHSQKAFVPKQGKEGTPVAGICREAWISQGDVLQLEEAIRRVAAG